MRGTGTGFPRPAHATGRWWKKLDLHEFGKEASEDKEPGLISLLACSPIPETGRSLLGARGRGGSWKVGTVLELGPQQVSHSAQCLTWGGHQVKSNNSNNDTHYLFLKLSLCRIFKILFLTSSSPKAATQILLSSIYRQRNWGPKGETMSSWSLCRAGTEARLA